jgi:virginiamycin A acetyltransferase
MPMTFLGHLADTHGQWLIRGKGGALVFAAADALGLPVHAAVSGADGLLLLEAVDKTILFDGATLDILPLWQERRGDGTFTLRTHRQGPHLRMHDEGLQPVAHESDAAEFTLHSAKERPEVGALAQLPGDLAFDAAGIAALIAAGSADMLPVVRALLSTLTVEEARSIWAAVPRTPARDVFHAAMLGRGRAHLPQFGAYTADLLASMMTAHGWSIGARTYGAPLIFEAGRGRLTIGRYCSLANPTIILGNHNTRSATSYPFVDLWAEWPGTTVGLADHRPGNVMIGNDVWIGTQAIILPGSAIGDGAIIGAGAVVRGAIPPYGICFGNPATVQRYRFDDNTIGRLSRLRWWDWPDAMVDRYIPLLVGDDIHLFLKTAEAEIFAAETG